jgi:hypothetical protein
MFSSNFSAVFRATFSRNEENPSSPYSFSLAEYLLSNPIRSSYAFYKLAVSSLVSLPKYLATASTEI